ncbi:hypothetical protein M405DRAFT_891925 [Rhizopogon salebrosus TDB-379]|nr:hypothetical protein M405DRAFT_891925 [Rhizopogon salebrosus TDB-379]
MVCDSAWVCINNYDSIASKTNLFALPPPILIIIELDFCELPQLPGLPPRHIPLSPICSKFTIGSNPSIRVTRQQLALIPAYAFTDFKSQGQTIDHVLVDIGKTTCFGLSLFNAYVALCCSRGRETIRFFKDFDDNLFICHPSEDLRIEDERIDGLVKQTYSRYTKGKYNPEASL